MKIVIIGSNGQLGTDCCNILGVENEIIGCDIPEIDISSMASVTGYLTPLKPEIIINCAAYTAVDNCETETELAWKVNAEGPANLAKSATELGARLIHISTDYVFDGFLKPPNSYQETDATNPLSEYGKSKLAGEEAVLNHASDQIILRTAWLYSAYGKNFLKTMLRLAVADPKREMKVVNDQHGSLTWSYTLARQIQKLLKADIQGVVHTTSEGHSTWYEAARYFLDTMGVEYAMLPCTTAEYPTPAHRPANSILENTVLNDAGISAFTDWKEDIDAFVEKYREKLLAEAKGE
ncbi:dTDP-4-dehydrorhamnose reductase [Desulfopila sp. IMCC35008]|uniref:dTDP-4-dehydrorhamnose reductase n=1 Tax=Desulfopila sp. IMCC35008 TaxID=2653858 RepID=UPI0013D62D03|nr:dTDP-4-dehydrorhamnose reductase [Desulfopila sp. IMCC35008]